MGPGRDLVARLPAGVRRRRAGGGPGPARRPPARAPRRVARLRRRARARPGWRSARCSPPRRTATTPSTTSASTRGSATRRTSTRWSRPATSAACGCCSTGCSTTSGGATPRSGRCWSRGRARPPPPGSGSAGRPATGRPGSSRSYDDFEGHRALVALDHDEPAVADHVVEVMTHWLDRGADGWRLDAAYAVPTSFWAQVSPTGCAQRHPDAYLVGEVIHGDYAGVRRRRAPGRRHPVRAVEGDLELAQRRQLLRARRGARPARRSSSTPSCRTRSSATTTSPGSPAGSPTSATSRTPWSSCSRPAGRPPVYAGDEHAFRGVKEDRAGGDDAVRPPFPASPGGALAARAAHLRAAPGAHRPAPPAPLAAHRADDDAAPGQRAAGLRGRGRRAAAGGGAVGGGAAGRGARPWRGAGAGRRGGRGRRPGAPAGPRLGGPGGLSRAGQASARRDRARPRRAVLRDQPVADVGRARAPLRPPRQPLLAGDPPGGLHPAAVHARRGRRAADATGSASPTSSRGRPARPRS